MQIQWNPLQYDLDQQRSADMRRAAAQHQFTAGILPPRRLHRAISRALFGLGGAFAAGGSALQARAGGLSAHLRRDDEPTVPRRASGY